MTQNPVAKAILEAFSQTVPRLTLLVNSKTHGKVALHMTFEGAKGQVCSL
jgi:hypothetical protein